MTPGPHHVVFGPILDRALREDLGQAGDLTTDAIVPPDHVTQARIVTRAAGRIAGLPMALHTFTLLHDPLVGPLRIDRHVDDGTDVSAGEALATLEGTGRTILTAERTALNVLGRLSGIATATRDLVEAVRGAHAQVACTRKTTPGLRTLEKYAVRAGGGTNHRFGLDDAVLIKDNHLAIAGGVTAAVERVRHHVGHMVKIEVEVDTLEQLREALDVHVDVVLLDNMSIDTLREAVALARGRAITEASGGITLESAVAIAETGVDLLSVGWITHSAPSLDVGLDMTS